MKSCIRLAIRQELFIYVLIVGGLHVDVDGHWSGFAPIGLHKTDTASDWLLMKVHCIDTKACQESSYKINRIT
jgi:hypothetical protein